MYILAKVPPEAARHKRSAYLVELSEIEVERLTDKTSVGKYINIADYLYYFNKFVRELKAAKGDALCCRDRVASALKAIDELLDAYNDKEE